jgi:hypothetical protein
MGTQSQYHTYCSVNHHVVRITGHCRFQAFHCVLAFGLVTLFTVLPPLILDFNAAFFQLLTAVSPHGQWHVVHSLGLMLTAAAAAVGSSAAVILHRLGGICVAAVAPVPGDV